MPANKGKGKAKGKGKSGKPRGRRTWAKGSKLELLLSFEEEHRTTADAGGLYKKITAQFLDQYGYDLPFDDEPAEGFVPVIPNLADLPYEEQITEQARRDDISLRLRVEFTKYWETAKLTMPTDARMSMCADYVKSRFEDETEEFRLELQQRADAEYKEKMDEYNKRDMLNGTPEAYARAWDEADNFLHIFVDAIAKKFGMTVSLLLAGPLGSEGGRVVMRSAHSNNVGGMTSLMWPEYDNLGFEKVQESIVRYAESVFSPEECKRRIPTDEGDNGMVHSPSPSDGPSASSNTADKLDKLPTISMSDIDNPSTTPEDEMNSIEATTSAGSLPAAHEPMNMNLIAGGNNDFGNVGTQSEGEFTSLLRHDWNWDATANQQPHFWTNGDAMGLNPCQAPVSMYPMVETFPAMPHGPAANFVNTSGAPPGFFMNSHGVGTFPVMPHGPSAPGAFFANPMSNSITPSPATTAFFANPMNATIAPSSATTPVTPHTPTAAADLPTSLLANGTGSNAPAPGATPAAPTLTAPAVVPGTDLPGPAFTDGSGSNAPAPGATPAAPTSTAPAVVPGTDSPSPAFADGTDTNTPAPGTALATPTSTAPAVVPGTDSPSPAFADGTDTNTPAPGTALATPTSTAPTAIGTTPVSLAGPESPPEAPEALPLNGKENKLPPKKKRAREEPAHPPARPQRAPKMPPHLADAGYVQPSKGTRKAKAKAKAKAPKKK
ncbi:hypothetical protein EYR38_010819 [Pleurotus pulmonarius]|nr:hypothetical protein EYR38_010819 [Pleurotus pulmonarius]